MKSRRVSRLLPRREFLRLSATAALGVAASGLIDPARLLADSTETLPLLSIGFAELPESGARTRLGAADSMLISDPSFLGRGAAVKIAGFGRGSRTDIQNGGIQFDAVYPVFSRSSDRYPRFNAWNLDTRDGVRTEGNRVRFTMPVTATGGLQFLIHRRADVTPVDPTKPAAPSVSQQNQVSLSLSSGSGPKLQRGVYVFAFRESVSDSAPAWSRYAVENDNGVLSVPGLDVSYVVVHIDYARD